MTFEGGDRFKVNKEDKKNILNSKHHNEDLYKKICTSIIPKVGSGGTRLYDNGGL